MTAERAVVSTRSWPRARRARRQDRPVRPEVKIERLEGRTLCDAGFAFQGAPAPAQVFTNPVINRDFPDPGAVYAGGSYYAFATNGNAQNVQAARSADLAHWTALPDALPNLPSWAYAGRTWAPDVAVTSTGT